MELRAGYKLTDVGVIPNDWLTYTVRDLIELLTDYDANGSFESVAVNVKTYDYEEFAWYVRSTDLENNASLNNVKYVDEPSYKFLKKTSLYGGELLFLKRGDIGNVYLFEMKTERATVAPNLYLLKLNQISNSKYLYYYFVSQTGQKQLKSKNASSTLGALYKDDVKSIIVPLPPTKAEQTAIATALSDADALISSLEKLIAKKRNIKQGAIQKLLQPKEGWEVKKLGEIAEVRDGTHQTPTYVESGIPFYSVESVTNNDFKNTKYITEEAHKLLTKTFKIEKGDILMTRIGSIGDCKLVDWDVNASFYVSLALLKIKRGFSSEYICHFSKTEYFKKEADINSLQSAIPKKINLGPISNIKILMPVYDEQVRIATILSDMDAEIAALEAKLEKYKKVKLGMMQNLLTGKIRLV